MNKFIYILLSFWCIKSVGQSQLFTLEDGLSSKNITCILQRQNGLLWVGTANGLNTYDGYTFNEITKESGLTSNKIKCLFEDKRGLLWIGTWKGLNILDQKTGKISTFFNEEKNAAGQVVNMGVTAIEEAWDGSILVGLGDGMLMRFTNERNYSRAFQLQNREKVFKYQIYEIRTLPDSSVFLLTNYGTIRKLNKHYQEDTLFTKEIKDVLCVNLSADKRGLILLDAFANVRHVSAATGKELVSLRMTLPQSSDKLALGYQPDPTQIWTGYGDGSLIMTDLNTKRSSDYSPEARRFITGAPTYIYEDKKKILWIGTNYGLAKFFPRSRLFENYLFVKSEDYKARNSIRGMIEDVKGDIYIGSYNGLFRINKHDSSTTKFEFTKHTKGRHNAYLPYRLLDDSAYIWMTSEIKGFYRFNKKTKDLELPVSTSEFFKAYALLHNDANSIWIGTQNGLFLYHKDKNTLTKYRSAAGSVNISNIEVTDLAKDSNGTLWIGSYSSGIFKMDKNGTITEHFSEANTHSSVNFISVLFPENDSTLWAGTRGSGIFIINTKTKKIKSYSKKNGLADNSIAGILKDDAGIFWISTFNGLSKFNPLTENTENYYDKDGLTENEFNVTAALKTRNGKLYFGGLNGVNGFYAQHLKREASQQPKIFLTRFAKYDGVKDSLLESHGDLSDLKDIHLSFKDKFFSFNFSLDDYYDPSRNKFYYILEGYEKNWTNIGTQNNIRFNTIPAGDYTLKIKGTNSEGTPGSNEISINLHVSQPFYTTWWFYLFLFFVTVVLVYSIARYRVYQVLKIKKLRTKISSDLHDEVGSLLTRITIQAELMKQGISKTDPVQEVAKIADTSRLATAAMSDVLWSIDARNDKTGNLIDRLREQAGEILYPLDIEVDFTVKNIELEKPLDTTVRQNVFLIFKEAIHNIAKHSGASRVIISLENYANQFVMRIEDNGDARSSALRQGQGLSNMHMRAELMEGVLEITKEKGYKVILKIKKL